VETASFNRTVIALSWWMVTGVQKKFRVSVIYTVDE
jgi:hypothetical protein